MNICFQRNATIKPPPIEEFEKSIEKKPEQPSIIEAYNKKMASVTSICYPSMQTYANGFKLNGQLVFEKNKKFRMQVNSTFGFESDVGSNNDEFWFWSKRLNPSALYHTGHEDIPHTRLKPSFNPIWLENLAGITEIKGNGIAIRPDGNLAIQDDINGNRKITIFDVKLDAPVSHYLYDKSGQPLAVVEIKDFYLIQNVRVPKKIYLSWIKENTNMEWQMQPPQLNSSISSSFWQMPNISPKINLRDY